MKSQPVRRKVVKDHGNPKGIPMVSYDSLRKCLVFKTMFQINGVKSWTQGVDIDLSKQSEETRQLVIAVAKQAINFANGHKIVVDLARKSKDHKSSETQEVKLEVSAASDVKKDPQDLT